MQLKKKLIVKKKGGHIVIKIDVDLVLETGSRTLTFFFWLGLIIWNLDFNFKRIIVYITLVLFTCFYLTNFFLLLKFIINFYKNLKIFPPHVYLEAWCWKNRILIPWLTIYSKLGSIVYFSNKYLLLVAWIIQSHAIEE